MTMRQIKFRAWLPQSEEMSVLYGFTLNMAGEIITNGGSIVMQFTGLHDKNGVEIYEGDIVTHDYESEYGPLLHTDTVEYQAGAFYPICEKPGLEFEVIGNIYQHKHLL